MRVEQFPKPGEKVQASDFIITSGGQAGNGVGKSSAWAEARWQGHAGRGTLAGRRKQAKQVALRRPG